MDQSSRRLPGYREHHIKSHDGLKIYYEVSGTGKKTLLFVHGLGGDTCAWDEIRVYLQTKGYRTIALDLRAHGYSEHPSQRSGYELTEFAQDIHAVIRQEKLEDFVLAGHCFGGMVVYTYDFLFPKTATALVLINASYRAPYMSQHSPQKLLLHPLVKLLARISPGMYTPRHVDYTRKGFENDFEPFGLFGVLKHNSLKTFLSATDVVFSLNVLNELPTISVPTLIISGTRDTIYPQKMSREMLNRIKQAEFVSVEGANHPIVLNNPMETAVSISTYLKKIAF